MILINSNTNDSYICSQKEIASMIGVCPVTISRWKRSSRKTERFNHWIVYLRPVKILQRNRGVNFTHKSKQKHSNP